MNYTRNKGIKIPQEIERLNRLKLIELKVKEVNL